MSAIAAAQYGQPGFVNISISSIALPIVLKVLPAGARTSRSVSRYKPKGTPPVPLRSISTASAPNPVGPYSQAIVAGGFVFTAGQVGLDPATGKIVEGLDAQVNQALDNIRAVLTAAGLDVTDIVKVTFFLTDMSAFGAVNAIYERFLGSHRPVRSTVGVAALPGGALFEVDAIALARQ